MTDTTERIRVTETPSVTSPQPPRRFLHVGLASTAVLLGLVAAVALLLLASDTSPQSGGRPADTARPGIPMSADAAERYFSGSDGASGRAGVSMSADAAERYFSGGLDVGSG